MKRAVAFALLLWAPHAAAEPRLVDIGARLGYARPVGAFDAATHAGDTSLGGVATALDATLRITGPSRWTVAAGLFAGWAETIPPLCGSASECIASLGHDAELVALARIRGPRIAFVLPEAELGTGWSWSSRSLSDGDATSTRHWSGPLIVRGAVIPSIPLGERVRLGLVVGGSIARSTAFHLEAPGLDTRRSSEARLHGTFDLAVRLAVDFGE